MRFPAMLHRHHLRLGSLLLLLPLHSLIACDRDDYDYDGYYRPSSYNPQPSETPANPLAPQLGATRVQADAPPPISGGTLIVTSDGERAIAADPDRDHVFVVGLKDRKVVDVPLTLHDEPGRLVEDGAGLIHVVLRRAGAIVSIRPTDGAVVARRHVCPGPRGIAYDASRTRLLVTCEDGQLLGMDAAVPVLPVGGGIPEPAPKPTQLAVIGGGDLRDIVVAKDRIFISRFRSAQLVELSIEGKEIVRVKLPLRESALPSSTSSSSGSSGSSSSSSSSPFDGSEAMIAWRMVAPPADDPTPDPIVVHEIGTRGPGRSPPQGYYGGSTVGCVLGGPITISAVSRFGVGGFMSLLPPAAVLPVDIATDGKSYAVVAAGNGHTRVLPQVFIVAPNSGSKSQPPRSGSSTSSNSPFGSTSGGCPDISDTYYVDGQPTAVAFRRNNALVVQNREPATLELIPEHIVIPLSSVSREDTGHAIFHSNTGTGLACASCHAEGGDDGHVWEFFEGTRRTPSLRGTIEGTAPYHWAGDVTGIDALSDLVMTKRMGGPDLGSRSEGCSSRLAVCDPGTAEVRPY